MTALKFVIDEPIMPAVRMTRRGKFVNPRAQEYIYNRQGISVKLLQIMLDRKWDIFDKTPLVCSLHFDVTQLHKCDLDNLIKAVLDAAQGIVYTNDSWIDSITASRTLADKPRLIFYIREIAQ